MKKYWLTTSILASLAFTSLAHAAPTSAEDGHPQWEISGSSNSVLSFIHTGDQGGTDGEFNLGAHAYSFLTPQFEMGAYLRYDHTWATGVSGTTFRLLASPLFNFSENPLSSFYVRGGIGLYRNNSNSNHTYNAFGYAGGFGKRFPITSTVTWTPEFSVSGHLRATDANYYWSSSTEYALTLFQFSILF